MKLANLVELAQSTGLPVVILPGVGFGVLNFTPESDDWFFKPTNWDQSESTAPETGIKNPDGIGVECDGPGGDSNPQPID